MLVLKPFKRSLRLILWGEKPAGLPFSLEESCR